MVSMSDRLYNRLKRRIMRLSRAHWSFLAAIVRKGFRVDSITFFPDSPHPYSTIFQIAKMLGLRISKRIRPNTVLVVAWEDCTIRSRHVPTGFVSESMIVINQNCPDISKQTLDSAHFAVFGYGLAVDPQIHQGLAVRKSNSNSQHNYSIVECPLCTVDEDVVYQVVVNNLLESETVVDLRVAKIGNTLPLCYEKRRPQTSRFTNSNSWARLVDVGLTFTPQECKNLLELCDKIGMDFGELDVLRDRDSGRIFVVDANNTPLGPPSELPAQDYWPAMSRLAAAFTREFL